jgi:hypothetical protein
MNSTCHRLLVPFYFSQAPCGLLGRPDDPVGPVKLRLTS